MVDYSKKGYKIAVFALVMALLALSAGGGITTTNYFNNSTCNCTNLSDNTKVNKSGDTMTGNLSMSENSIHDPLYFGNLSNNIYMYFSYYGLFKQIQTIVDNTSITQSSYYIILSASNSQVKVNNGIELLYNAITKFTVNSSGVNALDNMNMNNNNITDTNTITINNGITLYSPEISNNETYDFNSCSIGSVPVGWAEDSANGLFRCVSGGMVQLTHNSTDAVISNNYHTPQEVVSDNNLTFIFNVSYNNVNDYSYYVLNNQLSSAAATGIYLSIHNQGLYYYYGGWNLLQAVSISTNYTIKINNTKLSTQKFDIYVNNVLKGNQINFAGSSSTISYIHIMGAGGATTDEYLDDITINIGNIPSYSWCARVRYNGTLYTTSGVC